MADVYEQNLASKSTLTTSDYIRVVGSDNVSYKQLVSDVAKKIIETYAGSTLAGSAQSVQSAINALNSKSFSSIANINSFDSINEGISLGYIVVSGIAEGWYFCIKQSVTATSKELRLIGHSKIYSVQYRNDAWSTPNVIV